MTKAFCKRKWKYKCGNSTSRSICNCESSQMVPSILTKHRNHSWHPPCWQQHGPMRCPYRADDFRRKDVHPSYSCNVSSDLHILDSTAGIALKILRGIETGPSTREASASQRLDVSKSWDLQHHLGRCRSPSRFSMLPRRTALPNKSLQPSAIMQHATRGAGEASVN